MIAFAKLTADILIKNAVASGHLAFDEMNNVYRKAMTFNDRDSEEKYAVKFTDSAGDQYLPYFANYKHHSIPSV